MKIGSGALFADATAASETIPIKHGVARARQKKWISSFLRFTRAAAPFATLVGAASFAHAAPTIDMSGVTSVMQTVQTACLLIGAIIVLISLVFSVFSFAGGNIMRGVTGVAGVLFGGLVIGLGPTWISSLTGQAVQ